MPARYDFNAPVDLPAELEGTFGLVVIDPPFITEEVWEMSAKEKRNPSFFAAH